MSQQGYTWRRCWDGHGGQADDGTTVAIQVGVIEVAGEVSVVSDTCQERLEHNVRFRYQIRSRMLTCSGLCGWVERTMLRDTSSASGW